MNTPSLPAQPVSEMHGRFLAFRKQMVTDHAAMVAAFEAKLADLDAAIAAVIVRQPTPAAPQVELKTCRCGGTLRPDPASWNGLVHDRDGSEACTPGHSGPVAHPLAQTSAFPAVPQGLTEEAAIAVKAYGHLVGAEVNLYVRGGDKLSGHLAGIRPDGSLWIGGADGVAVLYEDIEAAETAEVSDQTTATPAAGVTVPDEAGS